MTMSSASSASLPATTDRIVTPTVRVRKQCAINHLVTLMHKTRSGRFHQRNDLVAASSDNPAGLLRPAVLGRPHLHRGQRVQSQVLQGRGPTETLRECVTGHRLLLADPLPPMSELGPLGLVERRQPQRVVRPAEPDLPGEPTGAVRHQVPQVPGLPQAFAQRPWLVQVRRQELPLRRFYPQQRP